ncbi:Mobilization protein A, partial [Xenorhabdus bovienii]|nr:Mobilization protein A [Xenorhabdus bovienii]
GDNADFYRDNDRQAVRLLSSQFEHGTDVTALLEAAQRLPQKVRESASGFMTLLQELGALSVLQTRDGVDLKDFILNGGCLYVVGSLRDESVIMLQKMLFVRCLQIIEERDRFHETTHVNIFLDEVKYLLSKSSLEALGTVRDKNCNILLTHQSLGDFGQCGADMKPEVV